MRISLKLEAMLATYAPDNPEAYEVPEGTTVEGLLKLLGIEQYLVMVVFQNGILAQMSDIIKDNATVAMCPFICGG